MWRITAWNSFYTLIFIPSRKVLIEKWVKSIYSWICSRLASVFPIISWWYLITSCCSGSKYNRKGLYRLMSTQFKNQFAQSYRAYNRNKNKTEAKQKTVNQGVHKWHCMGTVNRVVSLSRTSFYIYNYNFPLLSNNYLHAPPHTHRERERGERERERERERREHKAILYFIQFHSLRS